MMDDNKTIVELIKYYVAKHEMTTVQFADKICVTRDTVYKMYKRNSVNIDLLARISTVLSHNFFQDLADNYELANPIETEEERLRQRTLTRFMDVVPTILKQMNLETQIMLGHDSEVPEGSPMYDYLIAPYFITFTYGATLEKKFHLENLPFCEFKHYSDGKGNDFSITRLPGSKAQICDVALVDRTQEEWESLFAFIFNTIKTEYDSMTWYAIHDLQHIYNEV